MYAFVTSSSCAWLVLLVRIRQHSNVFVCLQQGGIQRSILSEEIGTYGTGLSNREYAHTDSAYDNTFQNDPGHTSRAEIRFNEALR
jgi:hypothetical protein